MDTTEVERKNHELKHLGFLRIAAIQILLCVSNLYEYAKQHSGSLKSSFENIEGAVTTVVSPVYERVKGVPSIILVFLDRKVDDATDKFDKHAPTYAKRIVSQTRKLIHKASHTAHKFVSLAQSGGPQAALKYGVSEYKQFLVMISVYVWVKLNQYPSLHTLAVKATPTVTQWSEKYNHLVKDMTQKGYPIFGYLPLVPVDEISKACKKGEAEKKGKNDKSHKSDSSSDSDSD